MGHQFMPKKGLSRAALLTELADTDSDLYQAIAAIGGGGGGGATFPMAEGVWYDNTTAHYGEPTAANGVVMLGDDAAFAGLIRVYEGCAISKFGVKPVAPETGTTTIRAAIYEVDAGRCGAKVGDLGTIAITDAYSDSYAQSDETSVAVSNGWYWIVVAADGPIDIAYLSFNGTGVYFTGPLSLSSDLEYQIGIAITETGIGTTMPSSLTGATQVFTDAAPRVLFQITHD